MRTCRSLGGRLDTCEDESFLGARLGLQVPTSAGKPSADRCQDLSICLKAAFSFAFCGSLLLCSEHHFCAPFSKMRAATQYSVHK